jgi:hypothetical protein
MKIEIAGIAVGKKDKIGNLKENLRKPEISTRIKTENAL